MGILSKIAQTLQGHIETSDHHENKYLRTHYYKSTKEKAMHALEDIINHHPSLSLMDVSKERGELAATTTKGKKGLLVVTVITVSPFKTSVDVSFTVDRGLLGGAGTRFIHELYKELDSQLSTVPA